MSDQPVEFTDDEDPDISGIEVAPRPDPSLPQASDDDVPGEDVPDE